MRVALYIITLVICFLFSGAFEVSAYWIWTPQSKKFINPKYAVKDSPKEQFDWAMNFYNAKDYERAAQEFEKLVKHYEYSEYASKAQYYAGLSYENLGKYFAAFQNYQKVIDNYPHVDNIDEIIARQFNIGTLYASKSSPKVLGTDILTSTDRAVEIYKKVVDNAPYGQYGDQAQYNIGVVLKQEGRYDEAVQAYQKLIDDYPASKYADEARYEVAHCAYKASLKPEYDAESTDKAMTAFKELTMAAGDKKISKEAEGTLLRLKDKAAEKSILTARFYERQNHYRSAIVYYQDVLDRYPESSYVGEAQAKIEELSKKQGKR